MHAYAYPKSWICSWLFPKRVPNFLGGLAFSKLLGRHWQDSLDHIYTPHIFPLCYQGQSNRDAEFKGCLSQLKTSNSIMQWYRIQALTRANSIINLNSICQFLPATPRWKPFSAAVWINCKLVKLLKSQCFAAAKICEWSHPGFDLSSTSVGPFSHVAILLYSCHPGLCIGVSCKCCPKVNKEWTSKNNQWVLQ